MRLSNLFLTLILSSISFPLSAQEIFIVHCVNGNCPTGSPAANSMIVREIFALSNNSDTKFADWVAYRVTRDTIGTSSSLNRSWRSDEFLDSDETLEPGDYTGANADIETDRGHQAPLASFAGTVFWRSTNILSNITPQRSELNQGPWVALETAVRNAVFDEGELYVITGPLFDPAENQLELPGANETHLVPTGYFKIVTDGNGDMTSFIFDQDDTSALTNYCTQIDSLDEAETLTDLTFFPGEPGWPDGDLNSKLGCSPL